MAFQAKSEESAQGKRMLENHGGEYEKCNGKGCTIWTQPPVYPGGGSTSQRDRVTGGVAVTLGKGEKGGGLSHEQMQSKPNESAAGKRKVQVGSQEERHNC